MFFVLETTSVQQLHFLILLFCQQSKMLLCMIILFTIHAFHTRFDQRTIFLNHGRQGIWLLLSNLQNGMLPVLVG